MDKKGQRPENDRLNGIEDRKIQIILELVGLDDDNGDRASKLRAEYALLDREYYMLRMMLLGGGSPDDTQRVI